MEDSKHVCDICDKVFKYRKNVYEHVRKVHSLKVSIKGKIICPLDENHNDINSYISLREHLDVKHGIKLAKEEHVFDNNVEFLQWKEAVEKKDKSFYKIRTSKRLANGNRKAYYVCHRTNSASTSKRASCQMGSNCPSIIDVFEKENKIHVTYYASHIGHAMELKHLSLSKSERATLASKLSDGVSIEKCLDDVRNSLTGNLDRIHLLTRKDLINIGNAEGILQKERFHASDAISIDLFVEEDKLSEKKQVVFYKPQGASFEDLNADDIILVIMTPSQKEMYKKFCHQKICVDSTHGTNAYDYQLSTIVVVDEFGAGFPAAFCISNRVDQSAMKIFFNSIAKEAGTSSPDIFMSDDAPAFYNAWKDINGEAKRQLLCTWHIDRNWRKALGKISHREKKVCVYKFARTIMEETDETSFKALLSAFLEELAADPDTEEFGKYFSKIYAVRPELWAYCYRIGSGINTNMYLEAMHKVLKHVYMQGKTCKRLDTCISHLLKMVRDKIFSRLTQMIKGGNSSKINVINKSHKRSISIPLTNLNTIDCNKWEVKSQTSSNVIYIVSQIKDNCADCLLKCSFCNVCIHLFNCTCIDFLIHLNVCKHIHFVQCNIHDPVTIPEVSNEIEIYNTVKALTSTSLDDANHTLKSKLNLALNLINKKNIDTETSHKVNNLMDKVLDLLNSEETKKKKVAAEPANKKIQLQKRFFSTKKKRTGVQSVTKPTLLYKQSIKTAVTEKVDVPVIHDSFDHTYAKH